ncbi:MAG: CBS domain-containing protein [Candidatus Aenigmarchaeota archaeon]|nr:CBS domain-containing protein [Candidatus Aenigmarchaeota archaeon]
MSIELDGLGVDGREKIIRIASKNPVFCNEHDTIADVADKIVATEHRRLPVLAKKGEVAGVLTKSDLLDAFLRHDDFDQSVSEIMSRELILCDANESLKYVLQKFKISRRGGFPVVDKKKLVGMISERDFVTLVAGRETGIRVENVMTKKPMVVQSGISVLDCLKTLVNTHYRRLPVVTRPSGGTLVGIVTASDLLKYIHENGYSFDSLDEPIDDVVIKDVYTANPQDDISQTASFIVSKRVGGLLVVSEKHELEGIITERDIVEHIS